MLLQLLGNLLFVLLVGGLALMCVSRVTLRQPVRVTMVMDPTDRDL